MYGINEILLNQVRNDYSMHLSERQYILDCSMGSNPYGPAPGLSVDHDVTEGIHLYPDDESVLKGLIAQRYADIADISPEMIVFSCGSIGSVLAINRLVCHPGKKVIGLAPTFTAVIDDLITYGVDWDPVLLRKERGFRFDAHDLLAEVDEHPAAYIYIDNPNNPTGQFYPLDALEEMVALAQVRGSFVLIDEAYGDYMPNSNSAIGLVEKYDNLVVTRTFSKGMGLAGARLGYTIGQPQLMDLLLKTNVPISMSSVAQHLAIKALESGWVEKTKERVEADKPRVLAALDHLKHGFTESSTPITLMYLEDEDIDLADAMLDVGIRVVSCDGYDGLGKHAVRVNLHDDIETLISLLEHVEQKFQKEK